MRLPDGLKELKTYEEIRAAWDGLFTIPDDPSEPEAGGKLVFEGNRRIAVTVDGIYVHLRKPLLAGKNLELTDVVLIEEPNAGHIRLTDRYVGEVEKSLCLLTAICHIPNAEVGKIGGRDLKLMSSVIGAFLDE